MARTQDTVKGESPNLSIKGTTQLPLQNASGMNSFEALSVHCPEFQKLCTVYLSSGAYFL